MAMGRRNHAPIEGDELSSGTIQVRMWAPEA
jgi:hypothetical protein